MIQISLLMDEENKWKDITKYIFKNRSKIELFELIYCYGEKKTFFFVLCFEKISINITLYFRDNY